jgi:hypothetical protein
LFQFLWKQAGPFQCYGGESKAIVVEAHFFS